ncbi:MAG: hypothetical protein WCV50_00805 [Patescibacteria group bacterium]|jgi:hypothetical protein
MSSFKLTETPTEELVDRVWLRLIQTMEEEILIQAELGRRKLTSGQRDVINRLFTAERCQRNYDRCSF